MGTDATFKLETLESLSTYTRALGELLRSGARVLTLDELDRVLPPRGPAGSRQNVTRGVARYQLNAAGFTCQGRRL